LQSELLARNNECSRASAELRIATKKRDEARAQGDGQNFDIVSVQRDFARLFKARQQTLIDQISQLEANAAGLRERIGAPAPLPSQHVCLCQHPPGRLR